MNKFKKMLILMMSFMMMFSSVQMNAFASETAKLNVSASGDGTITIVDSQGNTYEVDEKNSLHQEVPVGSKLTLKFEAHSGQIETITFNEQAVTNLEKGTKSISYTYSLSSDTEIKADFTKKAVDEKQESVSQTENVSPTNPSVTETTENESKEKEQTSETEVNEAPTEKTPTGKIATNPDYNWKTERLLTLQERWQESLDRRNNGERLIIPYKSFETLGSKLARAMNINGWTMLCTEITDYPTTLAGHSAGYWLDVRNGSQVHKVFCLNSALDFTNGYPVYNRGSLTTMMPYECALRIERYSYEEQLLENAVGYPEAIGVFLAAQNAVWDTLAQYGVGGNDWTTRNLGGNIPYYQSLLVERVNRWYVKPNFVMDDGSPIPAQFKPGDAFTLRDTNGVLGNYAQWLSGEGVEIIGIDTANSRIGVRIKSDCQLDTVSLTFKRLNDWQVDSGGNYIYHSGIGGQQYLSALDSVSQNVEAGISFNVARKGKVQVMKTSANTEITDGNDCYSLEGAVYGIYTDRGATNKVGELTTDVSGKSNEVELDIGTYYIKEISAPKGYALDRNVHEVSITSGNTAVVELYDYPQNDPIMVLLGKIDAETNANKPQGSASLENAWFEVKFYKGEYADNVDPASLGKTPDRVWTLKTDEDGFCMLSDEFKISGDNFYTDSNGIFVLPLGTLTIEEVKAPVGYKLNEEIFIRKIISNTQAEWVETYNEPTVPEQVVKFHIVKKQTDTNALVPNTTFQLTYPDGTTKDHVTNMNGEIELIGLATGTYQLKEINTIDGLDINENTFSFEILADGSVKGLTDALSSKDMEFAIDDKGDGHLTVYNDTAPFSLKVNKINDHQKVLDGAEFTLYSDKACTKPIETKVTENGGTLTFDHLTVGEKYYLKETKAPTGYRIPVDKDGNVHVYEITVESIPSKNIFNFYVDGSQYTIKDTDTKAMIHLEGTQANRIVALTVTDKVTMQLPETGSIIMPIAVGTIALLGILMGVSHYKKKKTR